MDKASVLQFLDFLGAGREGTGPRPAWNVNQLQYASVHFGLAAEDVAIRQIFKGRIALNKPGRYVDIGCAWPGAISNTFYLYMIGWRGICVDANRALTDDWAKVRPEDAFVWSAVCEGEDQLFWSQHKTNLGASMVQPTREPKSANFIVGAPVPTVRMDVLLDKYVGDKPIHLLNIDIEGGELSALKSNDWTRWRPQAIVMESHSFTFEAPKADPAISFLYDLGYQLEYKVGAGVVLTLQAAAA